MTKKREKARKFKLLVHLHAVVSPTVIESVPFSNARKQRKRGNGKEKKKKKKKQGEKVEKIIITGHKRGNREVALSQALNARLFAKRPRFSAGNEKTLFRRWRTNEKRIV